MRLCGIENAERVYMHPNDDPHATHYIDIVTSDDRSTFYVTYCCDEEWIWEFEYTKTNYEIVKHIIMDCVFTNDTMEELIDDLDDVFFTECRDMFCEGIEIEDDEYEEECDGDCEHCDFVME